MDLYTRLSEMLKNRPSKKLAGSTYVTKEGVTIVVTLYVTKVVQVQPDHSRTFRTGGWLTPTTKDRINEFGLCDIPNLRVSAMRGVWYLGGHAWAEDIGVNRKGEVVNAAALTGEETRKRVMAFVKRYMIAWEAGQVKPPEESPAAVEDGRLTVTVMLTGDDYDGAWIYRAMEFAVGLESGTGNDLSSVLCGHVPRPKFHCALSNNDLEVFHNWVCGSRYEREPVSKVSCKRLSAMLATYLLRFFNLPPARG